MTACFLFEKNLREVYHFVLVLNLICNFLLGNRESLNQVKVIDIPTQRKIGIFPFSFFLYEKYIFKN